MIGTALKELRLSRDITQTELADVLGRTQQSIAGWESNRINPDVSTLQMLAQYFGVTTDYLLGNETAGADGSDKRFTEAEADILMGYREPDEEGCRTLVNVLNALRYVNQGVGAHTTRRTVVNQPNGCVSNL